MASYNQWRTAADKGTVRKATWVCGTESVLVEEVVAFVKETIAPYDLSLFVGGADKDRDIWASLNQYPADSRSRVAVIREAQKIKKWEPAVEWLSASRVMPRSLRDLYLLGAGLRRLPPYPQSDCGQERFDGQVRPAGCGEVDRVGSSASRPAGRARPREPSLLPPRPGRWVSSSAVEALTKISLLGLPLSAESIEALAVESAETEFVDALLAGKKARALSAAGAMSAPEVSAAFGLLDSRLVSLERLHLAVKRNQTVRDIAVNKTVPVFLIRSLMPLAKSYDPPALDRRRSILALCDSHLRHGAAVGVLESLVALW